MTATTEFTTMSSSPSLDDAGTDDIVEMMESRDWKEEEEVEEQESAQSSAQKTKRRKKPASNKTTTMQKSEANLVAMAESPPHRYSLPPASSLALHSRRSWTQHSLPMDEDFDEDNAALSLVMHEWAGGTSIHGAASIADFMTWKRWKRLLWAILVCTSGGIMLWQITQLIKQYREYSVSTNTDIFVPPSLDFPEVTVCNYETKSMALMNKTGIKHPKTLEELKRISPPMEGLENGTEFIHTTTFNGRDMDPLSAWKPVLTRDGLCYSFQTSEPVLIGGSSDAGLEVSFYLNQEDYPTDDKDQGYFAGVEIWAETKGTPTNHQIPYFAATPGRVTLASIHKTEYKRETEEPWAHCIGSAPQYTQSNCRVQCINRAIRERCNCKFDYGDPEEPDLRFCSRAGEDQQCIAEFYRTKALEVLGNCTQCTLPPCSETKYQLFTTNFEFSGNYLRKLSEKFNVSENTWRQNIVVVNINFDSIEYYEVTQTKTMGTSSLLGSIGGSMGLFLGISIISVVEVFGDLGALRLIPRLCGYRHLHGVGARKSH